MDRHHPLLHAIRAIDADSFLALLLSSPLVCIETEEEGGEEDDEGKGKGEKKSKKEEKREKRRKRRQGAATATHCAQRRFLGPPAPGAGCEHATGRVRLFSLSALRGNPAPTPAPAPASASVDDATPAGAAEEQTCRPRLAHSSAQRAV